MVKPILLALLSGVCFIQLPVPAKDELWNPRPIRHVSDVSQAQRAFAEGSRRLGVHHYQQALSLFSMSIASDKTADAYASRASCYQHLEKPQLALKDCNAAIAMDPECADAYVVRAELYWEMHNTHKAIEDIGKACRYDQQNWDAFYNAGKMHEGVKDWKTAIRYFQRARELNPKTPASSHIGTIEMQCGNYREAIEDFTRSLKERGMDDIEVTYHDRAICYEKLGKMDLARQDRARAKSITEDGWGKFFGPMK